MSLFLNRARGKTTKTGLTLVELMLVVMIILGLVTVSAPAFRKTYEELKLTSCTKEVSSVLEFCRQTSIFQRRVLRFNIDKDKKTYNLLAADEDGNFIPLKNRWGRIFKIPEGIEIEAAKNNIDFFFDGKATSTSIYLTNKEGKTNTICIEQYSGFVKTYDYKKE